MSHEPLSVIVFLNRGGLADDAKVSADERDDWRYEFAARTVKTQLLGKVSLRFDPANPRTMIRENRNPRAAVICLQSADFELSPDWFTKELRAALRAKTRAPVRELGNGEGEALCDAVRSFLGFLADELAHMELATADRRRRFGPRANGGHPTLALDLSKLSTAGDAEYEGLLRLWWLSLDCVGRGIERALRHRLLADDPETRALRAPVLKLRAHLAAALLDVHLGDGGSAAVGEAADDRRQLAPALHQSVLDWIDFNLASRNRHEGVDPLETRHRDLGDLLFEVEAKPSRWGPFGSARAGGNGHAPEQRHWSSASRITVRKAILSATELQVTASEIVDHYTDSLRRAGDFFSRRYDVREMIAVSRAWFEIRSPAPGHRHGVDLGERIRACGAGLRELARGTLRHLPWPYLAILGLALLSWLSLGWLVVRGEAAGPPFGSPLHGVVSVLFTAQFSLFYLGIAYFVLAASLRRKRLLFEQSMPRVFGSLVVGFVPLWIAEETWTFPFYMRWMPILGSVAVVLLVSILYFVVEVSHRVKLPSEAMQKAFAVFLIAASQAYCIDLLISDFAARCLTKAMPFAVPGALQEDIQRSHQLLHVPSPLQPFVSHWPSLASRWPSIAAHEFWLLPKLVVFWFGLAMFVAVFLHMLWEKEGILERR